MTSAADTSVAAERLIAELGGHPLRALGGAPDPDDDAALGRWWVAAVLLGSRAGEEVALAAAAQLGEAGLTAPAALAAAAPEPLAQALAAAGLERPEEPAARLVRAARGLVERHRGSFAALLAEADGLEALGGALAGLAPGVGGASVRRFLAPLRERVASAGAVPLAAPSLAALACLGWCAPEADPESALDALRRRAREAGVAPEDLEAALERLGARACRSGRARRCPLGAACPRRVASPGGRD